MFDKLFLVETAKLLAFSLVVYLFVTYCEKRNELVANQFVLSESARIHHDKSYQSKNFNTVCPLYSEKLGIGSRRYLIVIKIAEFFKYFNKH